MTALDLFLEARPQTGAGAGPSCEHGILLVTAVPLLRRDGRILIDDQTCAGLTRWAEHFGRIVYVGIDAEEAREGGAGSGVVWKDMGSLPFADRLETIVLPRAYRLPEFLAAYRAAAATLAEKIVHARYLCFTLGALVGDWGAIAAREAIRRNRPYAVWFDRVEYEIIRHTLAGASLLRRAKALATIPLMKRYHQRLVKRSALGLFQGEDCFRTFAPFSNLPFRVYDTHTQEEDRIGAAELDAKAARAFLAAPLRILYVGRAAEMKGPSEWLRTLRLAADAGVPFMAEWLGDGPSLEAMKAEVRRLALSDRVTLRGFQGDRAGVLADIRAADLFLFCHKTPESPRCLIEALVSGTPLLGFESAYAADLTRDFGGGAFAPMGNIGDLAARIVELHRDRTHLSDLVRAAAAAGRRFDERSVYRERAELIRRHL